LKVALSLVCHVVVAAFLAGCSTSPKASEPMREFTLHGKVVRLNSTDRIATIRHEKIDGWMEAMTMEFPVREGEDLLKLGEGNQITATVYVQGMTFSIGNVQPDTVRK
jgi:Cu/Ag efflux protein CusF